MARRVNLLERRNNRLLVGQIDLLSRHVVGRLALFNLPSLRVHFNGLC